MDRRRFIKHGAGAAFLTAASGGIASVFAEGGHAVGELPGQANPVHLRTDLNRHRFGVNYTPSRNWWFCWNDWDAASIQRDLDAIAALGADHLRIMLIWPYFQPSATWVSPLHLERLDQLITFMGQRHLDAVVTVFTGQLSALIFSPPFHRSPDGFYTDPSMWKAQELFVCELSRTLRPHSNIIGYDFGNELDTCWQAPMPDGNAWMARMFELMNSTLPDHVHVNGVDHHPWFADDTFSAHALAAAKFPVMHCYPYWTGALKYGGAMDPPSVELLSAMAALIRSYAGTQQKPIWAGEFNTCIKQLPEEGQAEWLEKAVTSAIEQGVSWFSYWDSHDVDRKFQFNPLEYTLGLLTNDGRVKDQGRVFKQLAESYRGKPVKYPTASLPEPPRDHTVDGTWAWINDWLGWKSKNRA